MNKKILVVLVVLLLFLHFGRWTLEFKKKIKWRNVSTRYVRVSGRFFLSLL